MVNTDKRQKRGATLWIMLAGLLIGLLISLTSHAATYATVSKNKVTRNELFRLQIITDQKASSDDLDLTALNKDFYVDRPSFGTSVNIINGARSAQSQWDVSIAATRSGIVTIPSFTINGQKTQPIAIQVGNDATLPSDHDIVEIDSTLDKSTLYPNESTLFHFKLLFKTDPSYLQDSEIIPPSVKGVTLDVVGKPDRHREIINGLAVTVLQQTYRITASDPGHASVTEPQFKGTLLYNGPQGDTKIHAIATQAKVFPIHVVAQPSDYQGVWLPTSALSLKQTWANSQGKPISGTSAHVKVGDSLTRTIQLQVRGLSQERIPELKVDYPDALRVYKEKPQYQTLENGDTVMTLKQVVIPNQAGTITVPGISLNWWDTTSKRQRKSLLTGLTLQIAQAKQVDTVMSVPQPLTQPALQVVQQKDPGFWPYLTAGFAALWLITLLLLIRTYQRKPTPPSADPVSTASASKAEPKLSLPEALKQKDGIRIQQLVQEQLSPFTLDPEERQAIQTELEQLQAAIYSSSPEDYDPKSLLQLLAKLTKQQKKKARKTSVSLPDL